MSKENKNMYKKPRKNEELLLPQIDFPFGKPRRITTNTVAFNQHIIKIDEDLANMRDWTEEFNIIRDAGETDEIHLEICCWGGNVDISNTFSELLLNTPAMTVAHVGSACYSAATQIALACKDIVVSPYSTFMVHDSSYYTGGKQSDIVSHVMFNHERSKFEMLYIYEDFLTEAEVDMCLRGADMWFRGADLKSRLKNYLKARHEKKFWETPVKTSLLSEILEEQEENSVGGTPSPDYRPVKTKKQVKTEEGTTIKKGATGICTFETSDGDCIVVFDTADGNQTAIIKCEDLLFLE